MTREELLKQAAEEYDGSLYREDCFIAVAEWQKEQMMKDAVESRVSITSGGLLFEDLRYEDVDYADKVKVIIIKEEYE